MESYVLHPDAQAEQPSDVVAALAPLVVSPHYDDAVFSCGHLLAARPDSTVLTVCTSLPKNGALSTEWDARCGFDSAASAMCARDRENQQALQLLGAKGMSLGFLDSQYDDRGNDSEQLLHDSLSGCIATLRPASVFFPLGLFHEDHILVSDAVTTLCHHFPNINWYAYEDVPYRKRREWVSARLSDLEARGIGVKPFPFEAWSERKHQAVKAYGSQLKGLGYEDAAPVMSHTEQYWQIHPVMELL